MSDKNKIKELKELISRLVDHLDHALSSHDNIFEPLHHEEVLEDLAEARTATATISRVFFVKLQNRPTNYTKPWIVECSTMAEAFAEKQKTSCYYITEEVGGERRVHFGRIEKESGELIDSLYPQDGKYFLHKSEEFLTVENASKKKTVLA